MNKTISLITALFLFFFQPTTVLATQVKTVALFPSADAYGAQKMPNSKTGAYNTLYVGFNPTGNDVQATLINFNLSGIPKNATINSARLKFFQQVAFSEQGFVSTNFSIYIISEPWVESSFTWTNRPAFFMPDNCRNASYVVDKTQGYKELDIKCLVEHWLKGNNPYYGFYLLSPTNRNWLSMFYSKEEENQDHRAQLVVTYTILSPTPSPRPSPTAVASPVAAEASIVPAASSQEPGEQDQVNPTVGASAEIQESSAPQASPATTPTSSSFNLEAELAQVITAKNIKTAFILIFMLLALKMLLSR